MKPVYALLLAGSLVAVGTLACSSSDDTGTDEPNIKGRKKGGSDDDESTSSDESRRPTSPTTPPVTPPAPDGGSDAGPAPVCGAIPSCSGAKILPAITGDGAGTTTAANGWGSQWLSIKVREDSSSGDPLGVTAYLDAADGSQLDFFLYDSSCTTMLDSHVGPSDRKVLIADWGDTPFIDNTRTLMLEIRHMNGACDAQHTWQLEVLGGSGL
jgi:hypothetical protein